MIEKFPDGQICIEDNGRLVAVALTARVDYQRFSNPHTYDDLVAKNDRILYNPEGDTLYGLDVFIHPDYRGYRLGRRLYDARKDLCRSLNMRAILAGGRIPGYRKHADEMNPAEYIKQVHRKEVYDPILSFQLSNDFQVKRLLHKYIPEDEKSKVMPHSSSGITSCTSRPTRSWPPARARSDWARCSGRCVNSTPWTRCFARWSTSWTHCLITRATLQSSRSFSTPRSWD